MHSESQKHWYYLILMIYAYTVQQPEYDWYMQTEKDSLISIREI